MANRRIPWEKIVFIREHIDSETIGYIAKQMEIGLNTVKRYAGMSPVQAALLIAKLKNGGN